MDVALICTKTKPNIITNIQIQIQREVGQIGEKEFDGVVRRMRPLICTRLMHPPALYEALEVNAAVSKQNKCEIGPQLRRNH